MGRVYTVRASVAVTALQDIFEVLANTDVPVQIIGWHIAQTSDFGDAAAEILPLETVRGQGAVTSGSGGTVPGEQQVDDNDVAAVTVVEMNNTTRMVVGAGVLENLEDYGWNVRIPWTHRFLPDERARVNPEDRWTLALTAAPIDSIDVRATLWFKEI